MNSMGFSLDITENTRSLSNLELLDVIDYEGEYIELDRFVVLSIDRDDSIPAMLVQLWKFRGGYNHAISNVMQNDLGMNKQVPFYEPQKSQAKITKITEYRPKESGLSKKEEYFFDLMPESVSSDPSPSYPIPFKVEVQMANNLQEFIIPEWTPVQRLPLDRIKIGTIIELWTVDDDTNIMRVLKI